MKSKGFFLALLVLLTACNREQSGEPEPMTAAPVDDKSITAPCSGCHGRDGITSVGGAPFLAGQHPEYLVAAIREYVIGARPHERMRDSVVSLTDAEREAVANFYASLDGPWKGAEKAKPMAKEIDPKAVRAGKRIARQCTSCHGDNGASTRPGVPNLAGLRPDYFKRSLRAYLSGERTGAEIMKNFKYALSKRDIDNLADYFASLKPQRTSLAVSGNVKAGRKAVTTCIGCHGDKGNSINPDIPSLAGQNGRYLIVAMKHYRDGERKNSLMRKALHGFRNRTIQNIAAYYSRQTPASPASGESAEPGVFDPIADGGRLAATCDGCHGKHGNGGLQGIPRLSGQSPVYLFGAIKAYRDGGRGNENMKMFAASLSDVAIEKVSMFYATQAPTPNAEPGKGDLAAGEKIAAGCTTCHGEQGVSKDPKVPSLAAQNAAYLVSAIGEYASGKRAHEAMRDAVKELDKPAMRNVAAYFSAQSAAQPEFRHPEQPETWIVKCVRCHGPDGNSVQADKPIIAGQLQSYLNLTLIEYHEGKRRHSMMNAMLSEASLSEIQALAAYFAQQVKTPRKVEEPPAAAAPAAPAAEGQSPAAAGTTDKPVAKP